MTPTKKIVFVRARFNRVCTKNFFVLLKQFLYLQKNIFSMVVLTDEHLNELTQILSDLLSLSYPGSFSSCVGDLGFPLNFTTRVNQLNSKVLAFNKKIDKKLLDDALSSSI